MQALWPGYVCVPIVCHISGFRPDLAPSQHCAQSCTVALSSFQVHLAICPPPGAQEECVPYAICVRGTPACTGIILVHGRLHKLEAKHAQRQQLAARASRASMEDIAWDDDEASAQPGASPICSDV